LPQQAVKKLPAFGNAALKTPVTARFTRKSLDFPIRFIGYPRRHFS